jgi:hypothetical protein
MLRVVSDPVQPPESLAEDGVFPGAPVVGIAHQSAVLRVNLGSRVVSLLVECL